MRFALLCAAALAAAPAMSQDLVARQGNDTVRLADGPCTSQQVLARLRPEFHSEFKAAMAVVEGRSFEACWRPAGNACISCTRTATRASCRWRTSSRI